MKSTWGRRGMIMEKFGWTWHYVTWGLPFVMLNRIMADLPWFDYDKDPKNTGKKKKQGTNLGTDAFLELAQRLNNDTR